MNKEQFIEQYVASFLGSWAAIVYETSTPGWQHRIINGSPIEDAVFQAEETWKRGRELEPDLFGEDV